MISDEFGTIDSDSQRIHVPLKHSGEAVADRELELLQGTLDLILLKALTWGPMHGYAVARWVADTTGDDLVVEEGALYTALHRLEKRGFLGAEWGLSENNRKAKFYKLTPAGRRELLSASDRFKRYTRAVFKVLQTA